MNFHRSPNDLKIENKVVANADVSACRMPLPHDMKPHPNLNPMSIQAKCWSLQL